MGCFSMVVPLSASTDHSRVLVQPKMVPLDSELDYATHSIHRLPNRAGAVTRRLPNLRNNLGKKMDPDQAAAALQLVCIHVGNSIRIPVHSCFFGMVHCLLGGRLPEAAGRRTPSSGHRSGFGQ